MTPLAWRVARLLDVPWPNPAFALSHDDAFVEAARMRASPTMPTHPVLVLAGYRAWSPMSKWTARLLRGLVGGGAEWYGSMAYPWSTSITEIAARATAYAAHRWPGATIDVVGISMGGLVARAAPPPLRIARLFTLGTPHLGARLADRFAPDAAARAMQAGSAFLTHLNRSLPADGTELICYSRLRDSWVGATRTAPESMFPHWVSGTALLSHVTVAGDPRIMVDIARRLRGETPIANAGGPPPSD